MNGFKKIGEKIKFYREKQGLSLQELAQKTFLQQAKLERIEAGVLIYKLSTLQKISEALNIDLPELLNFD